GIGINPDPENRLLVSLKDFQRQMLFLKESGYNVIPLSALAELIRHKKKIPSKTLSITFDDGYKDNYTLAYPVLKKYGLPATIFVIYNEVGTGGKLSWQDIMKMQDDGLVTIASHTLNHRALVDVQSEEELRREIFDSKRLLEEKLGRAVDIFSYPIGAFNAHIRQLVIDAGYKLSVATNPGKDYPKNDLFALKRLRISSSSSNLLVFAIEISGFYTFIKEHRDD
ncbi:MAG: polysaccharide deacetylase family protein, partial [Candidatus Omnitrophica bacterium]|nr:polysaccharide deacetylase family protein [Candidatus Omnitrophota bacterium]